MLYAQRRDSIQFKPLLPCRGSSLTDHAIGISLLHLEFIFLLIPLYVAICCFGDAYAGSSLTDDVTHSHHCIMYVLLTLPDGSEIKLWN